LLLQLILLDLFLKVIYEDEDEEKKSIINCIHKIRHDEAKKKVTNRILKSYYWSGIWNDVIIWINGYHRYQICKLQPLPKHTEENITPVEKPFTRVGLNITGPLSSTKQENNYIIALVDYFTK